MSEKGRKEGRKVYELDETRHAIDEMLIYVNILCVLRHVPVNPNPIIGTALCKKKRKKSKMRKIIVVRRAIKYVSQVAVT